MRSTEIDYNVIASGSSGNAVRIENIMIDCGVPYRRMRDELYKVDTLLITHSHKDHLNEKTLAAIKREFPRIKVFGNWDVAYMVGEYLEKIISETPIELTKNRIIYPHEGVHDIPVTYFDIAFDETKVFYATDTRQVQNHLGWKYDYIFCESNYDEVKLAQVRETLKPWQYDPADGSFRHLSTKACKEFYYVNRKDKDTPLIELHKSSRFY